MYSANNVTVTAFQFKNEHSTNKTCEEREGFVLALRSWCIYSTLFHGITCDLAVGAFPTSN